MRIGDTSCTSFGRGTAHHEACEVHHGLVAALLLLLVLREAFLQELVNDKMYDGFTDAPPGSCYALPEPPDTLKQQISNYDMSVMISIYFKHFWSAHWYILCPPVWKCVSTLNDKPSKLRIKHRPLPPTILQFNCSSFLMFYMKLEISFKKLQGGMLTFFNSLLLDIFTQHVHTCTINT